MTNVCTTLVLLLFMVTHSVSNQWKILEGVRESQKVVLPSGKTSNRGVYCL